jgi:hypothetical protein
MRPFVDATDWPPDHSRLETAAIGAMQDLIERFTTWALDQADIRSAIIVGSQARADRPADGLSDLDLAVVVTDPSIYLSDTTWLCRFGEPFLTFVESTADGNFRERRVLFKDGRDVDFSLLPAAAVQQMLVQRVPAETADVLRRGFRILVDKDGLAQRLTDRTRWPESLQTFPTENDLVALAQLIVGAVMDKTCYFDRWEIRASRRWWALILLVDRNAGFGIDVLIFVFVVMPDREAGTSRCRPGEIAEKLPEKQVTHPASYRAFGHGIDSALQRFCVVAGRRGIADRFIKGARSSSSDTRELVPSISRPALKIGHQQFAGPGTTVLRSHRQFLHPTHRSIRVECRLASSKKITNNLA